MSRSIAILARQPPGDSRYIEAGCPCCVFGATSDPESQNQNPKSQCSYSNANRTWQSRECYHSRGRFTMALSPTVGDFHRELIPKVLHLYQHCLQEVIDGGVDDRTKNYVQKKLDKLSILTPRWQLAYARFSAGSGLTAKEQEEIENAVLEAERQLAKELPHIFDLSYYIPICREIPPDREGL